MSQPISQILHEFLTARRILAAVARHIEMSPSTLASELNPKAEYAKFALDDLERLCIGVKKTGYGDEIDGIFHEFFEKLKESPVESPSTDNLAILSADLMAKTALLADGTMRLINSSDDDQLREVKQMIRSELIPTSMRLLSIIDDKLSANKIGFRTRPQST